MNFTSDQCALKCPWCGPGIHKPCYFMGSDEIIFRSVYDLNDQDRRKYIDMMKDMSLVAASEGIGLVFRTNGIDTKLLQEVCQLDVASVIEVGLVTSYDDYYMSVRGERSMSRNVVDKVDISIGRATRYFSSRAAVTLMPGLHNKASVEAMCKDALNRFEEIVLFSPKWASDNCYCDSRLVGSCFGDKKTNDFINLVKINTDARVWYGG